MTSLRRVTPAEAAALIEREGFVYLDVRSVGEFEQGHPAGSYNVPIAIPGPGGMKLNADFLAVMLANFPLSSNIVVGCQAGVRSVRACAMLAQVGYEHLVEQRAGWGGSRDPFGRVIEAGWYAAGLPSDSGPDPMRGYEALVMKKGSAP